MGNTSTPGDGNNGSMSYADLSQAAVKVMSQAYGPYLAGMPNSDKVSIDPEKLAKLQAQYQQQLIKMSMSPEAPEPTDRRFSSAGWKSAPFAWTASLY